VAKRRSNRRRARKSRAVRWLVLLLLAALIGAFYLTPRRAVRSYWSERQGLARVEAHVDWIRAAAQETGLDANLLGGVMMVESRGHVDAQSPAGALGLFQLLHSTAQDRAARLKLPAPTREQLLTDGALNVRLGAHHLLWLMKRFSGDEERVLIAYNAGHGRLERWIKEAGSYAAWRDERERAGNSGVLAYARNVQHYRRSLADRGTLAPTVAAAHLSSIAIPANPVPGWVGPPSPTDQQ
jgi:soluble lytic murein transglycosylase